MWYFASVFLAVFALLGSPKSLTADNTQEKAIMDAYTYGYPLVVMDITKDVMTNTPTVTITRGPLNQLVNVRTFPDPEFHDVVSPNADTLYTSAWLDLSKEPLIFSVPNMEDRYYLFQMLDQWTNVFAAPGTRTTGQNAQLFLITGPRWDGTVPEGFNQLKSPTNFVWMIGRIATSGPSDYAAVNKLQDQIKLVPLSSWGKDYTPPKDVPIREGINASMPPPEQVEKMDGVAFFNKFANLLKETPIPSQDRDYVKQFAVFGLVPGQDFDVNKLSQEQIATINEASKKALDKIVNGWKTGSLMDNENGWSVLLKNIGNFGDHYDIRASVAFGGIGVNLPQDAVYPFTHTDSGGEPLIGTNKYVIHFNKDEIPPVKGFWSITLYNNQQYFVPNSLNRYAIGSKDKLSYNSDGSLDIYIQNESPGIDKEANWLPAPKDGFNLILRLYAPEEKILNGAWKPPEVKKIS